jgi:MoaA/NifB/PqqE/SkfB family radical SAM enzyme
MTLAPLIRRVRAVPRRFREARMFAQAMRSWRHPILAHIVPTRRCNLACAYCNEYDHVSQPVALAEMLRRVDQLAALGTTIITISGGEPLLHPELDKIIRRISSHRIIATLITNGLLLTSERIRQLNRVGLHQLQISIDNVQPNDVSRKSLKVLDQKLRWLAAHAEFDVNINAVIGAAVGDPEDVLTIARRAMELGFSFTAGVVHDGSGQLEPVSERVREILDEVLRLRKPLFSFVRYDRFQYNLARGVPNEWQCRAGSRYLYICENGLVHWCSQQRGYPGVPLERYTVVDIEREYRTVKSCAPLCTINCVQKTAVLDELRENPRETILHILSPPEQHLDPAQLPLSVRLLSGMFVDRRRSKWFSKVALRFFGLK